MNNNYEKIADLLFPNIDKTPEYYEKLYPARHILKGAEVTRFAPSPTGYVHMGSLLTAFYDYIFAKQSGGVFFLRIEDTDLERTVEKGVEGIISDLAQYEINADEGVDKDKNSVGMYGPYIQTQRKEIYLTYAKDLVRRGLAYPCFCTKEEIDEIRHEQEKNNECQIGYYGKYAKCRDLSYEEIKKNIEAQKPFVIRLKSTAKVGDRVKFVDKVRGEIEMSDSINDVVILKSGTMLPPYNFAHAIDDHLMHTTTVIRSNEWLNSVPEHIQIFKALGFEQPEYAHVAFVQRIDPETGTKRKISKRKDPETAISYMVEAGYPAKSVHEYLFTLANTNFEDWRIQNPKADMMDFRLTYDKISLSGALFDLDKFNDVSKRVIANMTAEEVYDKLVSWASVYDKKWAELLSNDKDYAIKFLSIDRYIQNPRKDIAKWSDTKDLYGYFYDELFDKKYEFDETFEKDTLSKIFADYINSYDENDDKNVWFDKIKQIGEKYGFVAQVKEYKKNPTAYKGHCGHVCNFIRVALTGKRTSPDLYEICKLFSKEKMAKRLNDFAETL